MLTWMFMKNNYFTIKMWEEWHYFKILQFSLLSGSIEDSWILILISAFNLLQYVVLVEVHEENPTSHSNVIRKRSILIVFT